MRMVTVMLVLVAGRALATSGAVFELGVTGIVFPVVPALETTVGYHHDFSRGGGIEVRARGGAQFSVPSFQPDLLLTATVHYVAPRIPLGEFALSFGVGAGGALLSGMVCSGDVCMRRGLGPILEATHRLLFPPGDVAQFFVNVNLAAGVFPSDWTTFAATGTVGVGWLIELAPGPSWRQKQRMRSAS